ncbi:MAG: DUF3618 domain-containing protein [Chloroflexota bacterium]|nr:DUF3618 domain-containing protein [Chloroflexota bacterium]
MSGGFDDVRTSGGFRSLGGEEADPRAEIEHTRAELGETIGAIQERLAPTAPTGGATDLASEAAERSAAMAREVVEQAIQEATKQAKVAIVEITAQAQVSAGETARALTEQAKASMREATIGRVERMANSTGEVAKGLRANVVQTIKQNPGPAALTALGIGWLVAAGGGSKTGTGGQGTAPQTAASPASSGAPTNGQTAGVTSQAVDAVGQAVDQVQHTVGEAASQAQATAGQVVDQTTNTLGQVVDQTTQTVGQVVDQVTETAGQAAEKTTSALGGVASGVKGAVTGVVSGVQHQAQRARTAATESPLRAGATAAVVGGALGLALPVSQRETALLGQTRDTLVDQIEQRAQTTLTKLQDVAQEAQGAAQREAKYQGIVPGQG